MSSSIFIYQDKENNVYTEVQLENETVWLSQNQLADLFKKTKQNISLHIRNIFQEGELDNSSVVKDSLTTAADGKQYLIKYYNLDVIISVGYRVKSQQGTRFRMWANKILKEYLVRGYSLDKKRLERQKNELRNLQKAIDLFQQAQLKTLSPSEATGLLNVLTNYMHSFVLLNQYDTGNLPEGGLNTNVTIEILLNDALKAINELKQRLIAQQEATELFGQLPKNCSLTI